MSDFELIFCIVLFFAVLLACAAFLLWFPVWHERVYLWELITLQRLRKWRMRTRKS